MTIEKSRYPECTCEISGDGGFATVIVQCPLCAAAPRLLEAAEALLDYGWPENSEPYPDDHPAPAMRQAIAAARGEVQDGE